MRNWDLFSSDTDVMSSGNDPELPSAITYSPERCFHTSTKNTILAPPPPTTKSISTYCMSLMKRNNLLQPLLFNSNELIFNQLLSWSPVCKAFQVRCIEALELLVIASNILQLWPSKLDYSIYDLITNLISSSPYYFLSRFAKLCYQKS